MDAAIQLISEFNETNICDYQTYQCLRCCSTTNREGKLGCMHWPAILKVLLVVCWFVMALIDKATAEAINEIFFEVLIAPAFDEATHWTILKSKKNRILLQQLKHNPEIKNNTNQF